MKDLMNHPPLYGLPLKGLFRVLTFYLALISMEKPLEVVASLSKVYFYLWKKYCGFGSTMAISYLIIWSYQMILSSSPYSHPRLQKFLYLSTSLIRRSYLGQQQLEFSWHFTDL
jgi:hypothetical protein